MTRLNTNQEVYHDLRSVGFYNDDTATDTLNGAAAVGDVAITLNSVSGFTAGDAIRVGANGNTADIAIIDTISGNDLNLKQPIAFVQANGAAVTELAFVDMGATSDAGVTWETSQDETPLVAGTQTGTYLYLPGAVETQFNFNLLGFNPENMAQAFGIDETGNMVTSSPEGVVLNPNAYAALGEKPWKFEGLREDGKTVIMHAYAAKIAAANVSMNMTTGTAAEVAFSLRSTGAVSMKYE
jgi:hypothetical protein